MSNAAAGNEQALVFCNGWMPDEGESIQQLFESEVYAGSLVPAALRQVPFTNPDGSEGVVDLYLDREAFAADVDPGHGRGDGGDPATLERGRVRHALGPAGVAVHPVVVPGGHRGPGYSEGGQRFMAERGNARIEEVAASHASMVSQPEAVTRLILSAVEATAAARP
jgi:hypothetical protein